MNQGPFESQLNHGLIITLKYDPREVCMNKKV